MKTQFHQAFMFLVLLIFSGRPLLAGNKKSIPLVSQEIRYSAQGASDVYLVWGINNWQIQDPSLWPDGTCIKGNLTYTRMKMKKGIFSAELKMPVGTTIDYVFWISKGPLDSPADIWDTNTEPFHDYHIYAYQNTITLIESALQVIPREQLSLLHFSGQLLALLGSLLIIFLFLKKYRFGNSLPKPGAITIMLVTGGVLIFVLFLFRLSILKKGWELYYDPLKLAGHLWIGLYDFLYVVFLTLLFILLYFLFWNYSRIRVMLLYSFLSIGLLSVVAGIINIRVVQILGRPFNYRWLYYSDFLFSSDAKAAMSVNFSPGYILDIIMLCVAIIIGAFLLICLIEFLLNKWKIHKIALTILICFSSGYFLKAHKTAVESKLNPDKLTNPVTEFLVSSNPFASDPELFTMEIPDSIKMSGKKKSGINLYTDRTGKIKNVLVIVLESVPAEYVQIYDDRYKVTPEIANYFPYSLVFDNMYAYAPATSKAFTSILSSIYPWLSYTCITQEHPDIDIPTLSSELKKHGFRTGYFNSGENDYQSQCKFLALRKFDTINDRNSIHCSRDPFAAKERYCDPGEGISDECTGKALTEWISAKSGSPFFAMMWTYQTHYPYYVSGKEHSFDSSNPSLNSFLNALHESDKMIGEIISELKNKGLFESTLVVIAGDHGEAFGRHDQTIHANKIYEENVHIPCIFINPAFSGERNKTVGGQADIAPTIMSALNLSANDQWQGKNLFVGDKNGRAYFFCPWSDYLFGYREGNRKFIFNATKNTVEVYDLDSDPHETTNLAPSLPEADLKLYHLRLAAWVQYQDKFIKEIFSRSQRAKKQ